MCDIVFSDGSATPYASDLTLTDDQKSAAIAVIFYAGANTDVLGAKTIGVGLKNTQGETTKTLVWAPSGTTGYTTKFDEIICTPSDSGSGKAATATFTGDLDGSDNWAKVCAADTTAQANAATNYPAFNWVNNYATTNFLTGDYASGWYLPTVAELSMLYRVKATVNAALEKAGGTKIADTAYWSSSQYSSSHTVLGMCGSTAAPSTTSARTTTVRFVEFELLRRSFAVCENRPLFFTFSLLFSHSFLTDNLHI